MAKTIRLNDKEEQALTKLQLRINKELVKMNMPTMQDTDIFHEIMKEVIIKSKVEVSREGKIFVIT